MHSKLLQYITRCFMYIWHFLGDYSHCTAQFGLTETSPAVVGQPVVNNVMQGYNACCFAYGQTGAGKTHTMQGELAMTADGAQNPLRGLTPRVFQSIFQTIESREGEDQQGGPRQYTCKCSFLQIYNEQVSDLLQPTDKPLALRNDAKNGVYVEDLSEEVVVNGVSALRYLGTLVVASPSGRLQQMECLRFDCMPVCAQGHNQR